MPRSARRAGHLSCVSTDAGVSRGVGLAVRSTSAAGFSGEPQLSGSAYCLCGLGTRFRGKQCGPCQRELARDSLRPSHSHTLDHNRSQRAVTSQACGLPWLTAPSSESSGPGSSPAQIKRQRANQRPGNSLQELLRSIRPPGRVAADAFVPAWSLPSLLGGAIAGLCVVLQSRLRPWPPAGLGATSS